VLGEIIRPSLAVLGVTALMLFLVEGALRLIIPEGAFVRNVDASWVGNEMAVADPVLGYRLKPGARQAEYVVGPLGYRGRDFSLDKAPGTFRIVCVGGSTTIGSNAGNNEFTYPRLLERMLQPVTEDCGFKVEVVNAGMFGYHSWHSVARLSGELARLEPDLIVIMDGLNDIIAANSMSIREAMANAVRREGIMSRLVNRQEKTEGTLADSVAKLRLAQAAAWLADKIASHLPFSATLMDRKLKAFGTAGNLEAFIWTAKDLGMPVAIVNYPWISRELATVAQEKERNPYGFQSDNLYRLYQYGRVALKRVNEAVSVKLGVPLADPQPAFDSMSDGREGVKKLYSDNMHLTRYGNMLLAKAVMDMIVTTEPLRSKVNGCQQFHKAYTDLRLERLFPDIFRWAECTRTGKADAACLAEAFPKMGSAVFRNVRIARGDDGWAFFAPEHGEKPGEVSFSVKASEFPGREAMLFPRAGAGENSVRVFVRAGEEGREELAVTLNGDPAGWTPVFAPASFTLPRSDTGWRLRIVLEGPDAQLWTSNYVALFRNPLD
jgi:lysophospholipase L1-like esterase